MIEELLNLANKYSLNRWNYDIVKFAMKDEEWYYFACTADWRPHYSSLPLVIRIDNKGNVEEIENLTIRMKISSLVFGTN